MSGGIGGSIQYGLRAAGSKTITEFGAKGDGVHNDSPAFTRAIRSMPNGGTILVPDGTYIFKDEVRVNVDNISIVMDHGAIFDITNTLGTGTPNIHTQVNMISAFYITGDKCEIIGGRFQGRSGTGNGNLAGIIIDGADACTIRGSHFEDNGSAQSLYTSIWPGNGTTDLKLIDLHISGGLSHNLLIGWDSSTTNPVSPQVNKCLIQAITSKGSTNDGVKLASFANDVQIIGGHFHDNTKDGIDTFVGGEYLSIVGAHCYDNGVNGIDCKRGDIATFPVPPFAINQYVTIQGCILKDNGTHGISAVIASPADYPDIDLDSFIITGNICEGNGNRGIQVAMRRGTVSGNICKNNGSRGYTFNSCRDITITGNVADDNCQTSQQAGFHWGQLTAGPPNLRVMVNGNVAVSSAKQRIGFSAFRTTTTAELIESSTFIGNVADGHSTLDYEIGPNPVDMIFRNCIGLKTENSGESSSISTGGTIAHGLHEAPTFAHVTAKTTGAGNVSLSVDATNITVTFDSGGSRTFFWEAKTQHAK